MEPGIDYTAVLPDGMKTVYDMEHYVAHCGLEPGLLELIKVRASQLNGCAYCLDMHTKDARSRGESEQRLYGLSAWRETPFYSKRERAALALAEAVTLISERQVPDTVYNEARKHFSDEEMVKLVLGIVIINVWNRFAITFREQAGSYEPDHFVTESREASARPGN